MYCYRFLVLKQPRGPLRASLQEAVDDAVAAGFGSRTRRDPRCGDRPGRAYLHPFAVIAHGWVEPALAVRLIERGRAAANDVGCGAAIRRRGDRSTLVDGSRVAAVTWL